nr:MAG TPA: replication protein O [Caudoviricetes sp.]DAW69174.1 MAG TPA: replication protein O [Caudoviricetes sp.]DAW78681.1 MAG TPA: replication protein O [Caudoviricetes sp.]DAX92694.1 MAG TPA: replication protein O [Caudoviricetes sp.]
MVRKRVVADESNVERQIYTREGGGVMSKFIPNAFQIPNSVIDELLAKLTCAELKCYLFVVRKTKGWNKESDSISVSQFMEVTGLSNRSVITACESLVEMGLLERSGGERKLNTYSVKAFEISQTGEKSSSDKTGENFSQTGEKSSSDLVKKVHTQNNNKNTIQNNNKKNTKKSESDLLAEFGIVGQLAEDFLKLRKAKNAPITETALKGFQREAAKAGISLSDAITIAIERNWRGFSASWNWRDDDIAMAANTRKTSSFADDGSWAVGRKLNIDPNLIPEELR